MLCCGFILDVMPMPYHIMLIINAITFVILFITSIIVKIPNSSMILYIIWYWVGSYIFSNYYLRRSEIEKIRTELNVVKMALMKNMEDAMKYSRKAMIPQIARNLSRDLTLVYAKASLFTCDVIGYSRWSEQSNVDEFINELRRLYTNFENSLNINSIDVISMEGDRLTAGIILHTSTDIMFMDKTYSYTEQDKRALIQCVNAIMDISMFHRNSEQMKLRYGLYLGIYRFSIQRLMRIHTTITKESIAPLLELESKARPMSSHDFVDGCLFALTQDQYSAIKRSITNYTAVPTMRAGKDDLTLSNGVQYTLLKIIPTAQHVVIRDNIPTAEPLTILEIITIVDRYGFNYDRCVIIDMVKKRLVKNGTIPNPDFFISLCYLIGIIAISTTVEQILFYSLIFIHYGLSTFNFRNFVPIKYGIIAALTGIDSFITGRSMLFIGCIFYIILHRPVDVSEDVTISASNYERSVTECEISPIVQKNIIILVASISTIGGHALRKYAFNLPDDFYMSILVCALGYSFILIEHITFINFETNMEREIASYEALEKQFQILSKISYDITPPYFSDETLKKFHNKEMSYTRQEIITVCVGTFGFKEKSSAEYTNRMQKALDQFAYLVSYSGDTAIFVLDSSSINRGRIQLITKCREAYAQQLTAVSVDPRVYITITEGTAHYMNIRPHSSTIEVFGNPINYGCKLLTYVSKYGYSMMVFLKGKLQSSYVTSEYMTTPLLTQITNLKKHNIKGLDKEYEIETISYNNTTNSSQNLLEARNGEDVTVVDLTEVDSLPLVRNNSFRGSYLSHSP